MSASFAQTQKLPEHLRLVPGFERFREGSPAKRKTVPVELVPAPATNVECGHIIEVVPPPDFDSKMVKRAGGAGASRMPVLKTSPACPGNVREQAGRAR